MYLDGDGQTNYHQVVLDVPTLSFKHKNLSAKTVIILFITLSLLSVFFHVPNQSVHPAYQPGWWCLTVLFFLSSRVCVVTTLQYSTEFSVHCISPLLSTHALILLLFVFLLVPVYNK